MVAMDQDTLKLLAKVKMAARKVLGLEIDVQRLTHDKEYAADVLGKASVTDNEDLVLAAITLQDRFGLLADKPTTKPKTGETVPDPNKYKLGARG
jgi:hypothetical protein